MKVLRGKKWFELLFLHTHDISIRPQIVVYWCSYGFEVSTNYVTSVIARIVDADSCIVTYLFRARRLFYFTEWHILHHTEQRFVQFFMRVTGDIGGSMGLLIGASVITLFEAVDAFTIALASRRRPRRSSNKKTENELNDMCPGIHTHMLACDYQNE